MSERYTVTLPKLGESIVNATVVQWFKKEGDHVAVDEPLLEVSTDKVNSEIPSPVAGVVRQILAPPDRELEVGAALAVIELAEHLQREPREERVVCQPQAAQVANHEFFSPALLRLAHENGISMEELSKVPATGSGGRISKRDLEIYIEKKGGGCKVAGVEHVKMTGMRKAIADNMVRSFYEAPHASLITQVDVTEVVRWIEREKQSFLEKHGVKLTVTAFAVKALAEALREYPLLNSSLEGDTIVIKRFVNVGVAVSVDQGILVPVLKSCQTLALVDIAKQLADLSSRARAGKLQPQETQEGTVTLTNFGISGVQMGIPIIRYPEVAILGMGAIHKEVKVLADETFGVRSMMHVSLTFDHRVLDGMYGCGFLQALKAQFEKTDRQ